MYAIWSLISFLLQDSAVEKENQAHSSFTLGSNTLGNPQNKTHIIAHHGNHIKNWRIPEKGKEHFTSLGENISESFKRKVSRPSKRSIYPESERERSSSRAERHRNEEVYQVDKIYKYIHVVVQKQLRDASKASS